MRYIALATAFDGTLARGGRVGPETVAALERLRASGRRIVVATGRRLEDLREACPHLHVFDYVIAENGGVAHAPRSRETRVLAEAPRAEFLERLRAGGVEPLHVGEVAVATGAEHAARVLQAVRECGLEVSIAFNRDSLLVLPPGVNKASGLAFALGRMGLSHHEVVGIGDSENDHSFLARCECAVAVANAVPSIRAMAAFVTRGECAAGVAEVIDELVANDLACLRGAVPRNRIAIGTHADATPVTIPPYGLNILVAGPSGSGKSTVAAGLVERLAERAYQVCMVDPEGDYATLREVLTLGGTGRAAGLNEALAVLEDPRLNLNVNLLGVPLADRPAYFGRLFSSLAALRARTGRPHWVVLDEAHHLMPIEWGHLTGVLPRKLGEVILVTVHPGHLPAEVLSEIDLVIAVGPSPEATLGDFARAAGRNLQWPQGLAGARRQVAIWFVGREEPPFLADALPPRRERIRHRRKYAEGNMNHRSFFFRGPGDRHNIRAHNLAIFCQIAEGIDAETWLHHLHRGDYSHWLRGSVKDPSLAEQVEHVERQAAISADESRRLVRQLIGARYTLPE